MKVKEFIKEVGYAAHMVDVNLDIKDAKFICSKDGLDVWKKTTDGLIIWFTKNHEQVSAYIITSEYPISGKFHRLYRLSNRSAQKGTVSMLVSVVVDEFYPLYIASDEELTPEGFKWLTSAIKTGLRGRKITNQLGGSPNINELTKEWKQGFDTGECGSSEIFIEGKKVKKKLVHPLLAILTEFVSDEKELI